MKAAQHPASARAGMIVLDEMDVDPEVGHAVLAPYLGEEAAGVAVAGRPDLEQPLVFEGANLKPAHDRPACGADRLYKRPCRACRCACADRCSPDHRACGIYTQYT